MKLDYISYKITNLISINKIVTIHYHELGKDFCYDGERHNFWEMVYVDVGCVKIDANNKSHVLSQGDVIFHKPNEFHTLKSNKSTASNVFVISFVCSSKSMNFFKEKVVRVPQKLRKYICAIIEEYKGTFNSMSIDDIQHKTKENPPIGGQQMIRILLEQFLILIIREEPGSRNVRIFPSKESMENHLVSKMISIIESKTYERLTVESICRELNYSRTYLSRIFKFYCGHTLLEYILMCKIREAKKLIRDGNHNFTQISDMLCFDNPHYFSRVFKRIENMTPSEYKNSTLK